MYQERNVRQRLENNGEEGEVLMWRDWLAKACLIHIVMCIESGKEPVGIPGKRIPDRESSQHESLGPQSWLNVVITLATLQKLSRVGFHPGVWVCVRV